VATTAVAVLLLLCHRYEEAHAALVEAYKTFNSELSELYRVLDPALLHCSYTCYISRHS